MKRILLLLCSVSMLLLVTAPALFSQTQEQPLGDVARLARRQKPAPTPGERVYDNDNLPGKGVVNTADIGTRLGNNAKYAEQERQYQEQIAAKQKALDDAKQKLADMQEEARKSGVPVSARE